MKLKHLTLRGFKSFADRTRLDFASGVNVVVGPNGSGKSNILDAIAWVMGTQATKNLRTEKMEDVVFAGTETRPALSRAEVQLTFANDDDLMPLDLAEITITRRLFRDGTSEYELNGAPCRLLDIQELLSDGGIGRQQHVLVGQGQVGDVLNARPEDHRAVIEEAAGVTKHRSRRDRAERRLERTGHDVERLNDILVEKRRALRPLKRQANAAARHDSVKEEAHAITLFLGGEEVRRIRARLGTAAVEREASFDMRTESDALLEGLKHQLEQLRDEAGDVGAALGRDTAAAARLETVKERFHRVGTVARERRQSALSRIEGAGERREDLEIEQRDLEAAIADAGERSIVSSEEAERLETALMALEDEERSLAEQIQLPAEGVVANLRGDLRALETAAKRDGSERDQIVDRAKVVADRIEEERREIERLHEAIRTTDARVEGIQASFVAAKDNREVKGASFEEARAAETEQRVTVARCQARIEALEAALEGLIDERARELATTSDGISGSLVAALDVPDRIAPAVDAALGPWRDAYVALSARAAGEAATRLRSEASGGISFVTGGTTMVSARPVAAEYGVDALVDLLGDSADRTLAESYLGHVLLVEGWQAAQTIVSANPELIAVTPEGDLVAANGLFVAQPDGAGPAALEAARVNLEVAERDIARQHSLRVGAERSLEQATADERLALDALESIEAGLAGHTEALGLVERSLSASQAEQDRLAARRVAIDEAASARDERIVTLRDRVAEFEGEEAVRQAAWEALNERRESVALRRDDARRAVQEAAAVRASIDERKRLSERRLGAVRNEMQQLTLIPASAEMLADLERVEAASLVAISAVEVHIETLRVRQRELRQTAGTANDELERAETRREGTELRRRKAADELSALDIELAELRVRLEAALEAIRRDADADEATALAAPRPETDHEDLGARLASLLADLKRMGPINPLAAHEHEELAADVANLDSQLVDLEESRTELRKVISALDEKMVALFEQAFSEIAEFFHENFALVFPGGKGRLSLTDPSDPLGTGVLVEAQPAGKKVGRLSLLSGGERSLAALAFLFAVFRARPSPFYVLDEVEAALDDANLHRFLRLVETLRRNTQLVIITHQQQTMEAADVLYGVTMEPGESSKVISKRMTTVSV